MLSEIRDKINRKCLVMGKISRHGCEISLHNTPRKKLVINLDHENAPVDSNQTRCDFLFFSEKDNEHHWNYAIPIELKGGSVNAREIVSQMRGGVKIMDNLIPENENVRFCPIAVYGGTLHKGELRLLMKKENKISFRNNMKAVRLMRSGSQLVVEIRKLR